MDLKHEIERELSQIKPPDLWERIQADAADPTVVDLTTARRHRRPSLWLAAAVMALVVLIGALAILEEDQTVDTTPATEPTTTTAPPTWGPDLDRGTTVHLMADRLLPGYLADEDIDYHEFSWQDPSDVTVDSIDVLRVRSLEPHPGGMNGYWSLGLAAMPPPPADLAPGMIVTFGVAFDTNADGMADYTAGIDATPAIRDGFRAWATDLATGETEENDPGGYGFPIEFNYAADTGCSEDEPACAVDLMFISAPEGLNPETARLFVWTAVTRDGVLVANDYVPDTGWMASE